MNAIEATDAVETQPAWDAIKSDLRWGNSCACASALFSYLALDRYGHGNPEPLLLVASAFFLILALPTREEIWRKLGVVALRDDEEARFGKESSHMMAEANKVRVVSRAVASMISSWLVVFSGLATLDKAFAFLLPLVTNMGFSDESFDLGWKTAFGLVFVVWFAIGAMRNAKDARLAAKRLLVYKLQPRIEG
jgi:hypothetical protein